MDLAPVGTDLGGAIVIAICFAIGLFVSVVSFAIASRIRSSSKVNKEIDMLIVQRKLAREEEERRIVEKIRESMKKNNA